MTVKEYIYSFRDDAIKKNINPETGLRLFMELTPYLYNEIHRISGIQRRFMMPDTDHPENHFEIHITIDNEKFSGYGLWYVFKGEDNAQHRYALSTPYYADTNNYLRFGENGAYIYKEPEATPLTAPYTPIRLVLEGDVINRAINRGVTLTADTTLNNMLIPTGNYTTTTSEICGQSIYNVNMYADSATGVYWMARTYD